MKKLILILILAISTAALATNASTFEIGTMPLAPAVYTNTATVPVAKRRFQDTYNFTFPAGGFSASGSAVTVDVQNILGIQDLRVDLSSGNTLLASGATGTSSWVFDTSLIPGTIYNYTVSGVSTGYQGGVYTFISSAAPVPEAATLTLSLLGISMLSLWTKRKKF